MLSNELDVVILDVMLFEFDGFFVLEKFCEEGNIMFVLLLSVKS